MRSPPFPNCWTCWISRLHRDHCAMGCQREIAQQITGRGRLRAGGEGESRSTPRGPETFEGAEALGFDGVPYDYSQTVNKGHGRVERRECWTITETDCLDHHGPN